MNYFKSLYLPVIVSLFGFNSMLIPMDKQNQKTEAAADAIVSSTTAAGAAPSAAQAEQPKLTLKQLQVLAYPFDKQANGIIKTVRAKYENEADAIAHVKKALEKRADRRRIDDRDENGKTALMYASMNGLAYLIPELVAGGATVDATDNVGQTALSLAAFYNHPHCAETLLELNAEINHRNRDGKTVLMDAALGGAKEIVEMLLACGADHTVTTQPGFSALSFAHRALTQNPHNEQRREIMYMLLRLKGKPTIATSQTPPPTASKKKSKKNKPSGLRSVSPMVLATAAAGASSTHSSPTPASSPDQKQMGRTLAAQALRKLTPSPASSPNSSPLNFPASSPDSELMAAQSAASAATPRGEFDFAPIQLPAGSPTNSVRSLSANESASAGFQSPLGFASNEGGISVTLEPIATQADHVPVLALMHAASANPLARVTESQEESAASALTASPLFESLQRLHAQSPVDNKALAEKSEKARKRDQKKKQLKKLLNPGLKVQSRNPAKSQPQALAVRLADLQKVEAEMPAAVEVEAQPAAAAGAAGSLAVQPVKPVAVLAQAHGAAALAVHKEAAEADETQEPVCNTDGYLNMYYSIEDKYEAALLSSDRDEVRLALQRNRKIFNKFKECGYKGWERKSVKERIEALKERLKWLPKPQAE